MALTVDFKVLCEEEYGYEEGVLEYGGLYARIPYLVKWADRFTFVNQMVGLAGSQGVKTWNFTPAQPYPLSPNMHAWGATIKPYGTPNANAPGVAKNVAADYPGTDMAIVVITFRTPMWYGMNDPQGWNSFGVTPAEQEALQYADQEIDYGVEFYSQPTGQMVWTSGALNGQSLASPIKIRVPIQTMSIIWHRFPFLPTAFLQPYVGTLNSAPWLNCDTGTVMFIGAKTNRSIDTNGQVIQQLRMVFKWRQNEWNLEPVPGTNAWGYVTTPSTSSTPNQKKYPYKNFQTLISFTGA